MTDEPKICISQYQYVLNLSCKIIVIYQELFITCERLNSLVFSPVKPDCLNEYVYGSN